MRNAIVAGLLVAVAGCVHHQPIASATNPTYQQLDALPTPKDQMQYLLDKQEREGKYPKAEWDYFMDKEHQKTQAAYRQMCAELSDQPTTTLSALGCPTPQQRAKLVTSIMAAPTISEGPSFVDQMEQDRRLSDMKDQIDRLRREQDDLKVRSYDHDD
jgi:hypothetical protein